MFNWWISKVSTVFGWVSIPIRIPSMWFGLKFPFVVPCFRFITGFLVWFVSGHWYEKKSVVRFCRLLNRITTSFDWL